jgi:hypothetical protein
MSGPTVINREIIGGDTKISTTIGNKNEIIDILSDFIKAIGENALPGRTHSIHISMSMNGQVIDPQGEDKK